MCEDCGELHARIEQLEVQIEILSARVDLAVPDYSQSHREHVVANLGPRFGFDDAYSNAFAATSKMVGQRLKQRRKQV